MKPFRLLTLLASLTLLLLCRQNYTPEQHEIINTILAHRAEKDSVFLHADWSPLTDGDKADFEGLKYFPVDLSLRFEGPIIRYDTLYSDTIMGTRGDIRPAVRYGYFPFQHELVEHRLEVYKIIRDEPAYQRYFFLGFKDQTTGKETYGTGRYIDLEENDQNHYVVDFNLAYNPYCAYNPRYTCAIPPEENLMPFAVQAGEKNFKAH